jgi:hypothetical protein
MSSASESSEIQGSDCGNIHPQNLRTNKTTHPGKDIFAGLLYEDAILS